MLPFRTICAVTLLAIGTVPVVAMTADTRKFELQGGKTIYQNVCQGCHMSDAKGAAGAGMYPALANNPRLATANYVMNVVIKGQKGMPAFGDNFTNQQIADVVNYVRAHFGNRYRNEVRAADVQSLR